jgi:hypothetical protein
MARNIADAFHVVSGQDCDHAGRIFRGVGIDTQNAGKGVRRADEKGERLVRLWRVGDVAAEPANEGVVLDAAMLVLHSGFAIRCGVHFVLPQVLMGKFRGALYSRNCWALKGLRRRERPAQALKDRSGQRRGMTLHSYVERAAVLIGSVIRKCAP